MKLLTGLFRATRKRMMTKDNDMGMFREKLMEIVEKKDSLSDEEISTRVEELKEITQDLPDDEEKGKLVRFLEDFNAVKEQDAEVAKKAAEAVAEQYEKLDTKAMQDVPGAETHAPLVQSNEPEKVSEEVEEAVEETTAKDGVKIEEKEKSEIKDDDPNPEYSLEEIYQFIKKRMAEDAEADIGEETEEEAEIEEDVEDENALYNLMHSAKEGPAGYSASANETKDECEEEVVTDHAPRIPVTMNRNAVGGNLSALFNLAKGGR